MIYRDYFWPRDEVRDDGSLMTGPVYPENIFERRFSVTKSVFNCLFTGLVRLSGYFRKDPKPDCCGKMGISPLQKVVAAMRQLTGSGRYM